METLQSDIYAGQQSKKYDSVCKKALSNKEILGWILTTCVDEFKGLGFKEIAGKYIEEVEVESVGMLPDQTNVGERIHGLTNEDTSINETTITYDIRFHAYAPKGNELIKLIINVEPQDEFYQTYPIIKRALYYCSRMISSQYGVEFTKSHYEKIKKVYSIWICTDPPKYRANTITKYRVDEENLIGDVKETKENYDLICPIIIALGDSEKSEGLLRMLEVLLSRDRKSSEIERILTEEFDISMSSKLRGEISDMCNLSEGLIEKGRLEGRIEGGLEKTVLLLHNLMESMKISLEQAAQLLKVPEEEIDKCKELIDKK